MVTLPTLLAGGVQSNSYVAEFGPRVLLKPVRLCSMYCSGKLAAQVVDELLQESEKPFWHCAEKFCRFCSEHINVVLASVNTKLPAIVAGLLASRAVSWKPQPACTGSAIVTFRCCFTPGTYVLSPGKVTLTLPRLLGLFTVPTWQPAAMQALGASPGTPQ